MTKVSAPDTKFQARSVFGVTGINSSFIAGTVAASQEVCLTPLGVIRGSKTSWSVILAYRLSPAGNLPARGLPRAEADSIIASKHIAQLSLPRLSYKALLL